MERDAFVFYRSFYDAIIELPRDIQGDVLTAIFEYGLNGATTDNLKPVAKAIFTLIKPQIDANNKKFINGSKGGAPAKNVNGKTQPKPNLIQPSHNLNQPRANLIQPKENVKENVKEKEIESSIINRKLKFSHSLNSFLEKYGKDVLRDFERYWTEPNKSNTKFRQELEKTWDLERRLDNWTKNDFNKPKNNSFNKLAVDQSENKNFFA